MRERRAKNALVSHCVAKISLDQTGCSPGEVFAGFERSMPQTSRGMSLRRLEFSGGSVDDYAIWRSS
jgi:hypothetical protein